MMKIFFEQVGNDPRFGPWVRRVQGRPSWVTRIALTAAVLTVVVPLVLLVLAALVVGVAVFVVLGLVATIINGVAGIFGGGSPGVPGVNEDHVGRRNVRVIDK